MKNEQLEYYLTYDISPEHQNIDDIETHYARRKKLYRQCGIPELAFRDAEILEVGPAGGYNTIVFLYWGCKHIDLVEANLQGIKDMQILFKNRGVENARYDVHECTIEEYKTEKKYDIIIAEGFVQHMSNREEIIRKLKSLVSDKGIIVITCGNRISFFIEDIKRLVGRALTENIPIYEEKVKYLTSIFEPQLAKLKGVSKVAEDWVKDIIFNPEINSEYELSLVDAMCCFGEDYDVLGCSPQMFVDYSWYKDIWYDYKKDYAEQFGQKQLSLLMANIPEVKVPVETVDILVGHFESIIMLEAEYELTHDADRLSNIIKTMNSMQYLVKRYLPKEFVNVFQEIEDIISSILRNEKVRMENYPNFFGAFGRTQQYISFVKR